MSPNVDVRFVTDEADAALTIIGTHAQGRTPTAQEWKGLWATAGYVHLKEREAFMGRAFDDSSFAHFLMSDSVVARLPDLQHTVPSLEHTDISGASAMALAYLPANTRVRARLYLEIKPITNSFVFTGGDSIPSIFLYVQTNATADGLKNTLAHELHHIGTNAACWEATNADSARTTAPQRMLLDYLTAFGEGRAMLAAAGSATTHPHLTDPDSIRARWDRDVRHAPDDVRELSAFFNDVVTGRIASSDSVRRRGNSYFGVQGPWYTVGWLMASTVERELGRAALINTLCTPVAFLAQYNHAAELANASRDAALPVWPKPLLDTLASFTRTNERGISRDR